MEERMNYISILLMSLKTKEEVLNSLTQYSRMQEKLILDKKIDSEEFDAIFAKKDGLIAKLNEEDAGFEKVYERVSHELKSNTAEHKDELKAMQELIGSIVDKSVKLKAIEQRNKTAMEQYFASKRREIKDISVNSKTVTSYYKNMTGAHQEGVNYFMDKKK